MTPVAIICAIAAVEVAVGIYFYRRDGETAKSRDAADWARIKGMFAEDSREDLAEVGTTSVGAGAVRTNADADVVGATEPWPVRQTPTDLQAAYEDVPPPWPWRSLPLEYGLRDRFDRYEVMGVNRIRSIAEILPGDVTQEFRRIVEASFGTEDWKCPSCTVGRDGEDQHVSCPGCACHCGDNQGAQLVHIGEPGRNAWMENAA